MQALGHALYPGVCCLASSLRCRASVITHSPAWCHRPGQIKAKAPFQRLTIPKDQAMRMFGYNSFKCITLGNKVVGSGALLE